MISSTYIFELGIYKQSPKPVNSWSLNILKLWSKLLEI